MQIHSTASEHADVSLGTFGGILHDLCQPLTALECSLELAMLRGSFVEMKSLASVALDSARRLHILANQAQAIEALCRQFCRPSLVTVSDIAAEFTLSADESTREKKLYIDPAGVSTALNCISGPGTLRGSITELSGAIQFLLEIDVVSEIPLIEGFEAISRTTLASGLVEHLGGRCLFSGKTVTLEFNTH